MLMVAIGYSRQAVSCLGWTLSHRDGTSQPCTLDQGSKASQAHFAKPLTSPCFRSLSESPGTQADPH